MIIHAKLVCANYVLVYTNIPDFARGIFLDFIITVSKSLFLPDGEGKTLERIVKV